MIEKTLYTQMLVVPNLEDIAKLDEGMKKGSLVCYKIGTHTYLGFFAESPESTYQFLKTHLGVVGEIHWIPLPHSHTTK